METALAPQPRSAVPDYWNLVPRYSRWSEDQKIPIYKTYYVEDLRTLELGPWEDRECNAAFVVLTGQEGVTESLVTEIPPGATLPPFKFGIDDLVYVLDGRGITTIWAEGQEKKSFEWTARSMFMLPRNYTVQISNTQGSRPARLLHYNYLPTAMSIFPDPMYFFNNKSTQPDMSLLYGQESEFYSTAKFAQHEERWASFWLGNFFPDMMAWDKFRPMEGRGVGASSVSMLFPSCSIRAGLPTMAVGTYKKGHQHGPGVVVVIPGGDGFSVMWRPDPGGEKEKIYIPWHEGSIFVPPNMWWHQHFNVGATPARYLTLHPARNISWFEGRGEERNTDSQIEYVDEDPWIRQKFEEELTKRGVKSLMPEEAYTNRAYEWSKVAPVGDIEHVK
ncbi:MAG: hypothetical protein HW416_275 [Chloroflexi bacterium]|nr:hypothetical protein [Chloroflexota bacterium]